MRSLFFTKSCQTCIMSTIFHCHWYSYLRCMKRLHVRFFACGKLARPPVKFERIVEKSGCTRDRTRTTIFLVISSLHTTPVTDPRVALNRPEVTSPPSISPILPVLSPSNLQALQSIYKFSLPPLRS